MSSKAIASKTGSRGLKAGAPARRRRNTTVANNMRRGVDANERKTAGGLGAGVEPKQGRRKSTALRSAPAADDGEEVGRRTGHARANVKRAQARPEKTRRDRPVDTSKPGVAADDRKVGDGHTARRNTKLVDRKATAMLEDSATGKPSRKSTRRSANHAKQGSQLTRRAKRAVRSPEQRAMRTTAGAQKVAGKSARA